jgi:hypothetical protein
LEQEHGMSRAGLKQQLIAVPSVGPARPSGRYEIDKTRTQEPSPMERADVRENIARLLEINRLSEEELGWIQARSSRPPEPTVVRPATSAVFVKEGDDREFGALQPFYREPTLERVQLQFADLSLDPSQNPLAHSSLRPPAKRHPSVPLAWGIAVGALALSSVGYLAALAGWVGPGSSTTVISPARRAMAPHVVAWVPPEPVGTLSEQPIAAVAEPTSDDVLWSVTDMDDQAVPARRNPVTALQLQPPAPAAPARPQLTLRQRVAAWRAREAAARAASAARPLASATSLPEQPSRDEIKQGLDSARPALQACAGSAHGLSTAHVTVTGAGRVASVTIDGAFAGTPEGSCMARALRAAAFPRFSTPSLQVTYPFRL